MLPHEAFDVRWSAPISDPFSILNSVGGDSPVVYESRLTLLHAWARQRAAATGAEGLLLGSVELHRHQVEAVRRVAADPVKRYLLADEVGLGKTIEAGALIWQYLAARPAARVLVVAPEHLRRQWEHELLGRFRIDHYPEAWLRIRLQTDERSWPDEPVDMLVIDEAHHVTRSGPLPAAARDKIARLAHGADAVLLLSATPVRSNEAGFLDLLHLLDPDHYRPDKLEDFVKRVELRDQLALTYQALEPDLDAFDLSLYADQLKALFPDDMMLAAMVDDATAADDERRPAQVARLRNHLSETYRLHHRVVRTRRTPDVGATFAVRGRRRAVPFTLDVADRSDALRGELLDSVRTHLAAAVESGDLTTDGAVDALRDIAARCGSLSHSLVAALDPPATDAAATAWQRFVGLVDEDVRRAWGNLIDHVHDGHGRVLDTLVELLSRMTVMRGLPRTVIASCFTESARAVAAGLVRRWGADRVAMHLSDQTRDANSAEVDRWRGDGPCSLLVCDADAEEGINLQAADLLVHLDLPWNAFRVEQRIGRCDRHAEPGAPPVPSAVVLLGDQPYAPAWFEFLADGCGVFETSVSSLQYVLRDTERAAQQAVLHQGPTALADAVEPQATTLALERTRITAHDALDAVDRADAPDRASSDDELLRSDRDPGLAAALAAWLEGVGAGVQSSRPGVLRVARKPRPQVPFDLEVALAPYLDTPLAFDRTAAAVRRLPVLRAGHPMVDAVAAHLINSDRGITFALFRPVPGQWPPVVVFRTDFVVSLVPGPAFLAEADAVDLGRWARQACSELAPPLVETVLATADGTEATHPALHQPYSKQRGDRNLASRPELFERLTADIDWSGACGAALSLARARLATRPTVTQQPETTAAALRNRIEQHADRDRSRALAGLQRSDLAWERLAKAAPSRLEPVVDVLGCGVIFVGDPSGLDAP